jgi:hypothetical protein
MAPELVCPGCAQERPIRLLGNVLGVLWVLAVMAGSVVMLAGLFSVSLDGFAGESGSMSWDEYFAVALLPWFPACALAAARARLARHLVGPVARPLEAERLYRQSPIPDPRCRRHVSPDGRCASAEFVPLHRRVGLGVQPVA